MTPVSRRGSAAAVAPRSVANTTWWPASVSTAQGTATSVTSKSVSGSGSRTRAIARSSRRLRAARADELGEQREVLGPVPQQLRVPLHREHVRRAVDRDALDLPVLVA